jgi:hypothetical protein
MFAGEQVVYRVAKIGRRLIMVHNPVVREELSCRCPGLLYRLYVRLMVIDSLRSFGRASSDPHRGRSSLGAHPTSLPNLRRCRPLQSEPIATQIVDPVKTRATWPSFVICHPLTSSGTERTLHITHHARLADLIPFLPFKYHRNLFTNSRTIILLPPSHHAAQRQQRTTPQG